MSTDAQNGQNLPDDEQLERAFEYYPRLERVREYVEENLAKKIPLEAAADAANLERKYFGVYFKAKTGLTFSAWLERRRIRCAKAILMKRHWSVDKIAEQVGYSHLRTFQRAFRRQVGMPPSVYRRKLRDS